MFQRHRSSSVNVTMADTILEREGGEKERERERDREADRQTERDR